MGTRGLVGIIIDDTIKATYNHWDSYPSYLGGRVLKFAAPLQSEARLEAVREQARALQLLTGYEDELAPDDALVKLAERGVVPDTSVGQPTTGVTWYQAMRSLQGNLPGYLNAGFMFDRKDFAGDSLFCEYGYLVNLDTREVEFYEGFQKTGAIGKGRFADLPGSSDGYGPIKLSDTVPFTALSAETIEPIIVRWEGEEA